MLRSIHLVLRARRREKGMTQSSLATAVGCAQSAICMFEKGRADALADETVLRMARELGVDLEAAEPEAQAAPARAILKYCPQDECPGNVPYSVGNRLCVRPRVACAPAQESTRCVWCGEVMESRCQNPSCQAHVQDEGAFCPLCGSAYVAPGVESADPPEVWASRQRARIRELHELSELVRRAPGHGTGRG